MTKRILALFLLSVITLLMCFSTAIAGESEYDTTYEHTVRINTADGYNNDIENNVNAQIHNMELAGWELVSQEVDTVLYGSHVWITVSILYRRPVISE